MPVYIDAAGCTNMCRHCARGGRPPFGAFYSLAELRELADEWGPMVVDHEPTAHPDFPGIMHPTVSAFGGGVLATNGFGLARAAEPDQVFARMRDFGYDGVSLTLHGIEGNHDGFVGRKGAHQDIMKASRRAFEAGFGVHWNIFLDSRNLEDVPRLVGLKQARFGGTEAIEVPHHTVSRRLWRYEELRPSAEHVRTRLPRLCELDPDRWRGRLEERTEAHWLTLWESGAEPDRFANPAEPKSWPPTEALGNLVIFIARDREVYLEPLCAPSMRLGRLDEGRSAIENRLWGLREPRGGIDQETAERVLGSTDLLHPTGASVRYKAMSAAVYGP